MTKYSSFKKFEKNEKVIRSESSKSFPDAIKLAEESFDLLDYTLYQVCKSIYEKEPTSQQVVSQRVAALLIAGKYMQSTLAAFNLFQAGYYSDAYVISRTMLESVLLCGYFRNHPEVAEGWLNGRRKIEPSELLKEHARFSDRSFGRIWGNLSDFVHLIEPISVSPSFVPVTYALATAIPKAKKDALIRAVQNKAVKDIIISFIQDAEKGVGFGPYFDRELFDRWFFIIPSLNYLFLFSIRGIFRKEINRKVKARIMREAEAFVKSSYTIKKTQKA